MGATSENVALSIGYGFFGTGKLRELVTVKKKIFSSCCAAYKNRRDISYKK